MKQQREKGELMNARGRIGRIVGVGLASAALTMGLMTLAPAASSGASTPTTVTWAEPPAAPPNFIFPFMGLAFFSVYNSEQFQYLMYRPLYWFGDGATPNLNIPLSLATAPTYDNVNNTVTIDLDNYKWSDGETVTAENVMFWMNMLHAEKANWAGYSAGAIPDDVKSIVENSPEQLTFTLTGPVNDYWFTYNELSQITPMPNAWDITAKGGAPNSGGCAAAPYGTADAQCKKVYTFLSKQSGYDPSNPKAANNSLSTYATSPIWAVEDGPWKLTHFDAEGNVTFVPNPTYSGPRNNAIKKFVELPYTSDSAEFNALVGGKVNVGYLPTQDITKATNNALKPGPNNPRLGSFKLEPLYGWAINYFPYNFNSTGDGGHAGAIFKQLYFRQAVQLLVDQPLYNKKIFKGYSVGTYGPVPSQPANSFVSPQVQDNAYYPYNPGKAVALLKDHGWKVVPNGTSVCEKPGTAANECGAKIPKGAKLSFNLQYASGTTSTTELMNAEKSSWSQAGINMSLSQASFNSVIGTAVPCSAGSKGCGWELQNWGAGWIFAPDYYPTGEELFQTGAGSNSGSYSDPTNDANITATNTTQTPLTAYENYLAQQLPVIYQPNAGNPLYEVQKNLQGFSPASPLQGITPESWSYSS
jgi:peptide/nickel transport system substrate-binding protein